MVGLLYLQPLLRLLRKINIAIIRQKKSYYLLLLISPIIGCLLWSDEMIWELRRLFVVVILSLVSVPKPTSSSPCHFLPGTQFSAGRKLIVYNLQNPQVRVLWKVLNRRCGRPCLNSLGTPDASVEVVEGIGVDPVIVVLTIGLARSKVRSSGTIQVYRELYIFSHSLLNYRYDNL